MGELLSRYRESRLARKARSELKNKGSSGLLTPEGQSLFRSTMAASNGRAVVVIHPFFPDREDFDQPHQRKLYDAYQTDLRFAIEEYQRRGLPLVVFEEEGGTEDINMTIKRMGGTNGPIFVVPTQVSSPEPIGETSLDVFTQQLAALGLQEAIVTGSYLDHLSGRWSPRDYLNRPIPGYGGCVGNVLRDLQNAGIATRLGITISTLGWITR